MNINNRLKEVCDTCHRINLEVETAREFGQLYVTMSCSHDTVCKHLDQGMEAPSHADVPPMLTEELNIPEPTYEVCDFGDSPEGSEHVEVCETFGPADDSEGTTILDDLLEKYPNANIDAILDTFCPGSLDPEFRVETYCGKEESCKKCWNRKIN